jgi:hypothetical protein
MYFIPILCDATELIANSSNYVVFTDRSHVDTGNGIFTKSKVNEYVDYY